MYISYFVLIHREILYYVWHKYTLTDLYESIKHYLLWNALRWRRSFVENDGFNIYPFQSSGMCSYSAYSAADCLRAKSLLYVTCSVR
jgi:hypothetical protein